MAANTIIHEINTFKHTCIVTLYDDDKLIIDRKNIGLDLNPDGTANTQNIIQRIKEHVFGSRLHDLENSLYTRIE